MDEKEMSIIEHFTELRYRLLIVIGAIVVFSLIAYFFSHHLINILTYPVDDLVFLSPVEAFLTHVKVAILFGLLLALPVIFYQFWRFLLPALKGNEKIFLIILIPSSIILFLAGIIFCFFVVMPLAIRFLLGFASQGLQPMLSLQNYISFVIAIMLPFGLIFELPLVMGFLVRFRLVTIDQLRRARPFILVVIFIIGALLTPPDIVSQVFMALPLLILFEGSLLFCRVIAPKPSKSA